MTLPEQIPLARAIRSRLVAATGVLVVPFILIACSGERVTGGTDAKTQASAGHVDALCAVMHLVEPTPEEVVRVHGAVPGVHDDLGAQESDPSATEGAERGGVDQAVLPEPGVPHEGKYGRQAGVDQKGRDALRHPALDLGIVPGGPKHRPLLDSHGEPA